MQNVSEIDHRAELAAYASGPDRLAEALSGLADGQLDLSWPGSDVGEWSIREIAHHIVDGDALWTTPVKMALGEPSGPFSLEWYWSRPQDEWAGRWGYATRPLASGLALFRANRAHVVEMLESLPGAWDRGLDVRWPDGRVATVTVTGIIGMQGVHALGHVSDILKIRREHGV